MRLYQLLTPINKLRVGGKMLKNTKIQSTKKLSFGKKSLYKYFDLFIKEITESGTHLFGFTINLYVGDKNFRAQMKKTEEKVVYD